MYLYSTHVLKYAYVLFLEPASSVLSDSNECTFTINWDSGSGSYQKFFTSLKRENSLHSGSPQIFEVFWGGRIRFGCYQVSICIWQTMPKRWPKHTPSRPTSVVRFSPPVTFLVLVCMQHLVPGASRNATNIQSENNLGWGGKGGTGAIGRTVAGGNMPVFCTQCENSFQSSGISAGMEQESNANYTTPKMYGTPRSLDLVAEQKPPLSCKETFQEVKRH